METVGINMTHDASFCHCVDGKVDLFIEEERDSVEINTITLQ